MFSYFIITSSFYTPLSHWKVQSPDHIDCIGVLLYSSFWYMLLLSVHLMVCYLLIVLTSIAIVILNRMILMQFKRVCVEYLFFIKPLSICLEFSNNLASKRDLKSNSYFGMYSVFFLWCIYVLCSYSMNFAFSLQKSSLILTFLTLFWAVNWLIICVYIMVFERKMIGVPKLYA